MFGSERRETKFLNLPLLSILYLQNQQSLPVPNDALLYSRAFFKDTHKIVDVGKRIELCRKYRCILYCTQR